MIDPFLSTALYQGDFSFFNKALEAKVTGYGTIIILTSLVVYILYIKRIFERDIPPPISAWSLWLLLDVISVSAEFDAGNFNVQLIVYTNVWTYPFLGWHDYCRSSNDHFYN